MKHHGIQGTESSSELLHSEGCVENGKIFSWRSQLNMTPQVGYMEFQLYPTGDQASPRCSKGSTGQNSVSKRLRLQYIRYRRLRGPHPVTGRTVKVKVRDYRRREGRLIGEKY